MRRRSAFLTHLPGDDERHRADPLAEFTLDPDRLPQVDEVVVFCADVGSVKAGNFSWARGEVTSAAPVEHDQASPQDLASAVAAELVNGRPVALGFECPLFVPVPEDALQLGMARQGEGSRPWSAGAGTGALATGLVQTAWVLRAIRAYAPSHDLYLDWENFARAGRGLYIWEAFVTAQAKGATHYDDAAIAVAAFAKALPDPPAASAVTAARPLSLVGAAALWSGWLSDRAALHSSPVVIRA